MSNYETWLYLAAPAAVIITYIIVRSTERKEVRRIIQKEKEAPICNAEESLAFIFANGENEVTDWALVKNHTFEQVPITGPGDIEVKGIWKYKCRLCGFTILRHSPLNINENEKV